MAAGIPDPEKWCNMRVPVVVRSRLLKLKDRMQRDEARITMHAIIARALDLLEGRVRTPPETSTPVTPSRGKR